MMEWKCEGRQEIDNCLNSIMWNFVENQDFVSSKCAIMFFLHFQR